MTMLDSNSKSQWVGSWTLQQRGHRAIRRIGFWWSVVNHYNLARSVNSLWGILLIPQVVLENDHIELEL